MVKQVKENLIVVGKLYVTLSHEIIPDLLRLKLIELKTYLCLQVHKNKRDKETWISQRMVAREIHSTRKNVNYAIKTLERLKFIEKDLHFTGNSLVIRFLRE